MFLLIIAHLLFFFKFPKVHLKDDPPVPGPTPTESPTPYPTSVSGVPNLGIVLGTCISCIVFLIIATAVKCIMKSPDEDLGQMREPLLVTQTFDD